jgi:tetraacyldisaccharide 4'-kinase
LNTNIRLTPILKNSWLSILLTPISFIYEAVIILRNKLYDWQIFKSYRIPETKIISIGNLTVGGTGKTPAVELVVNFLTEAGNRVVILSRGYRRKSLGIRVVSDGNKVLLKVADSGDEPYLLAKNLPGVPVVVSQDRYQGSLFIVEKFKPDYIILDDGYQHRRLQRDMDIVLVDSTRGFGNGRTLPGGVLREPLTGLKRASMIWLTRTNEISGETFLVSIVEKYTDIPVLKTIHQAVNLSSAHDSKIVSLDYLKDRRVFLFSGIGNPESFRASIASYQAKILGELVFPDHCQYDLHALDEINKQSQRLKCEWLVTTEKDMVRIDDFSHFRLPVFYLRIELKIISGVKFLNLLTFNKKT